MIFLRLLCMAGLSLSLCACGNTMIPIDYHLPKTPKITQIKKPTDFSLSLSDSRLGVEQPNRLFSPILIDGRMLSKSPYLTPQPVAEIVKNAIADGLKQMGLSEDQKARIRIKARLAKIRNYSSTAPWQISVNIIVLLQAYDTKYHRLLWDDVFTGSGHVNASFWRWTDEPYLPKAFNGALTNLIRKIQNSPDLRMALNSAYSVSATNKRSS